MVFYPPSRENSRLPGFAESFDDRKWDLASLVPKREASGCVGMVCSDPVSNDIGLKGIFLTY
jgi:hypothetical protein